jgi:hypothetical protein
VQFHLPTARHHTTPVTSAPDLCHGLYFLAKMYGVKVALKQPCLKLNRPFPGKDCLNRRLFSLEFNSQLRKSRGDFNIPFTRFCPARNFRNIARYEPMKKKSQKAKRTTVQAEMEKKKPSGKPSGCKDLARNALTWH